MTAESAKLVRRKKEWRNSEKSSKRPRQPKASFFAQTAPSLRPGLRGSAGSGDSRRLHGGADGQSRPIISAGVASSLRSPKRVATAITGEPANKLEVEEKEEAANALQGLSQNPQRHEAPPVPAVSADREQTARVAASDPREMERPVIEPDAGDHVFIIRRNTTYAIGTRVRVVKFRFAMNKYLVVTNAGQQFYVPREYFSLEAPAASSHFNGVRSSKTSGKWDARIQHEGKTHQIGTFDDEIEAAKAWDAKARSLRGAATPTNFNLDGSSSAPAAPAPAPALALAPAAPAPAPVPAAAAAPPREQLGPPPVVAELDVDEEVLKKPTGGVQQAYLEAVQKRLRHETSRDCPATEEKWLLTELKSNEWWPRSHKAKWVCDKLGLVMSEQAYYVDICAWLPDVRWGAAAMPPCPAAPALTLVLIAGAAITSSGELRPSTGTISWSADATGAPRGSGEDCKSNGDGGGHRGRARRGGSDGVATSCPGRGPRAHLQEANVNILLLKK